MNEELIKYFNGDELAATVWYSKYALRDKSGQVVEETPDQMHRRLAKYFAVIEHEYWKKERRRVQLYFKRRKAITPFLKKYLMDNITVEEMEEKFYQMFKNFKHIVPGGSVMAALGDKNKLASLSNCFVLGQPTDSYNSINDFRKDQVNLMKRRGGVGKDLSLLRPKGAPTNNAAQSSTGAASFMHVDSELTRECAQSGRRKSA